MKNILFIAFLTLSVSAFGQTPDTKPRIKIYQPPAHTSINAMPLKTTKPPLLVLDGVVSHFEEYSAFQNKINDLNPNDIASIDIIKDEKAVVQYGEKGLHGVIIIKLKK
jgi:TonB-dependent starch-binding outer membrane protein SusC